MDLLDAAMRWAHEIIATWYGAAIVGGLLVVLAERRAARSGSSAGDIARAAAWYRQHYGERALAVIGDHILAAGSAPDGRYRRFLRSVAAELMADPPAPAQKRSPDP